MIHKGIGDECFDELERITNNDISQWLREQMAHAEEYAAPIKWHVTFSLLLQLCRCDRWVRGFITNNLLTLE
jgi:hypothetical protein